MAIRIAYLARFYSGLSSDTKPTNPDPILFYETDTGDWFIFNGSNWVAFYYPAVVAE